MRGFEHCSHCSPGLNRWVCGSAAQPRGNKGLGFVSAAVQGRASPEDGRRIKFSICFLLTRTLPLLDRCATSIYNLLFQPAHSSDRFVLFPILSSPWRHLLSSSQMLFLQHALVVINNIALELACLVRFLALTASTFPNSSVNGISSIPVFG